MLWEEGKGPDLVVELTSASTAKKDLGQKKQIYRDILRVREYVLFDPYGEYLKPALQGFLLQAGDDVPMPTVLGRLPSDVLGLHFEADGENLRLYNATSGCWLRTPAEDREFAAQAAAERDEALAEKKRVEQELAELRRRLGEMSG